MSVRTTRLPKPLHDTLVALAAASMLVACDDGGSRADADGGVTILDVDAGPGADPGSGPEGPDGPEGPGGRRGDDPAGPDTRDWASCNDLDCDPIVCDDAGCEAVDCDAAPDTPACSDPVETVDCNATPAHAACADVECAGADCTVNVAINCADQPQRAECQGWVDCWENPNDPACDMPVDCSLLVGHPDCTHEPAVDCAVDPAHPDCGTTIDCLATPADPMCVGGPSDPSTPAFLDGEGCLNLGENGVGMKLCGSWRFEPATATFIGSGDMTVETPLGPIDLLEVDLRVSRSPLALSGSAKVPFPKIGFLEDAGLVGDAPRASLSIAPGHLADTIEINGHTVDLDDDQYYLVVDYNAGLSVEFGPIGLSTPGGDGMLVIAPQEPFLWVAGDLAGLLTGGFVDDAAIGFSLAGRLPYSPQNELYDGQQFFTPRIDGHLYAQGSVQLGKYPINVYGDVFVDVDGDDDGTTVFQGDGNDVIVGADGAVSVGYSKFGFDLSAEVSAASLLYDGTRGPNGAAYLYARSGLEQMFEGTVLEFLEPEWQTTTLYAAYEDLDDFTVRLEYRTLGIFGYHLGEAWTQLGSDGVRLAGKVQSPGADLIGGGQVDVEGSVQADGAFSLTGTANVNVIGYTVADAAITLANSGLAAAGRVDLPALGHADVSGALMTSGAAHLTGAANISPAGFQVANAQATVATQGASATGNINLPGLGRADISGAMHADGRFAFNGNGDLAPLGFPIAGAAVAVAPNGANVSGRATLPAIGHADVSGEAYSDGRFSLAGAAELAPAGFRLANGRATIAHNGAGVSGRAGLPGLGNVDVSGSIQSNGNFSLTGRGDLSPAGLRIANASVTIDPRGAAISGRTSFAGSGVDVSGRAQSNGNFALTGGIRVNAAILNGNVAVTISNQGASGEFSGRMCVPYTENVCNDVCRNLGPLSFVCDEVCNVVNRTSCVDLPGARVGTDGQVCATLPVVGRRCVHI